MNFIRNSVMELYLCDLTSLYTLFTVYSKRETNLNTFFLSNAPIVHASNGVFKLLTGYKNNKFHGF